MHTHTHTHMQTDTHLLRGSRTCTRPSAPAVSELSLIHMRHDSFIRDMTHSNVTFVETTHVRSLVQWVRRDSFIRNMAHAHVVLASRHMSMSSCSQWDMTLSDGTWLHNTRHDSFIHDMSFLHDISNTRTRPAMCETLTWVVYVDMTHVSRLCATWLLHTPHDSFTNTYIHSLVHAHLTHAWGV